MMKKFNGVNSLSLTELNVQKILKLDHPNIGPIFDIIEDEKYVYMVQDYYEHGDLFSFLLTNKILNENFFKIVIKQILSGIKYLHSQDLCHRALKPQNIYILKYDEKKIKETLIKICDFGASSYFKNCLPLNRFAGNPFYSAPEEINGEYSTKSDIWSVGIICYFLITGVVPFSGKEYDVLFKVK